MSHELRTPMNGVLGMMGLAPRRVAVPEARGFLDKADGAAKHQLALLNDILDFSKIEAQRLTLERAPLTIGQVTEELVTILGQRAADKGLSLVVDLDHSPVRRHGNACADSTAVRGSWSPRTSRSVGRSSVTC